MVEVQNIITDRSIIFLDLPIPASFCLFSSFPHHTIQYIYECVDDMLGTQTRGDRMEGTDESTSHFFNLRYKNM